MHSRPLVLEKRWTNLRDGHELYDAGHLMEAAVAHFQATGNRKFLEAMCRNASLIARVFGLEKGQKHGYGGHPEVELALVKLYRATNERQYLKLAKYFVDERGRKPCYFDIEARARGEDPAQYPYGYEQAQAHIPVRAQKDVVGHAVCAVYLFSGMADVAAETGDKSLINVCRRLWKSVTLRRMYVTGGIGSFRPWESFTFDYDLPNEIGYAETCAGIGLVFFAHRMLQIEADADYADVMERALYNGVLSGVSLDGKRFFYTNPLTVYPEAYKAKKMQVSLSPIRKESFRDAAWCCPPNIARLLASLGQYIYSQTRDEIYLHLYVGSRTELEVMGKKVTIIQRTEYPWKETVKIVVQPESSVEFTLALRIPGWCRNMKLSVNRQEIPVPPVTKKGYAVVRRFWERGDCVELVLPMPVERIEAHPNVRMDCGKVALQRGPIVYCLEEIDNGKNLADIALPRASKLHTRFDHRLLGGTVVITGRAFRRENKGGDSVLYRPLPSKAISVNIKAVPYCLWNNRKSGEMLVWIREK